MKFVIRVFTLLLFLAGAVILFKQTTANHQLAAEVDRLEAELGKMSIGNANKVHIVEIKKPDVPPEVALHVARIWQFRCYLPPGYDFIQLHASGRVAEDGLYHTGGSGTTWGTPKPTAIHGLLTVSLRKKGKLVEEFYSFGGSSGTMSWNSINSDPLGRLVAQKLASVKHGPRSFDQQTLLPVLKVFDPSTAEDKEVAGETLTTYEGGLFVLCPKARQLDLQRLSSGNPLRDIKPEWLATAVSDE